LFFVLGWLHLKGTFLSQLNYILTDTCLFIQIWTFHLNDSPTFVNVELLLPNSELYITYTRNRPS